MNNETYSYIYVALSGLCGLFHLSPRVPRPFRALHPGLYIYRPVGAKTADRYAYEPKLALMGAGPVVAGLSKIAFRDGCFFVFTIVFTIICRFTHQHYQKRQTTVKITVTITSTESSSLP